MPIDSPDSFTSLRKVFIQKADGDSWILVSLHKALTTQCACVCGLCIGIVGAQGRGHEGEAGTPTGASCCASEATVDCGGKYWALRNR